MEKTQDAINMARRAYAKEWRAKNKDKCKEYRERYWLKRAQEMMAEQSREAK